MPVTPGAGVLVVGYGNELCGDDVVGPLAVSRMAGDPRFRGASILAVRQLAPELADDMRDKALVVLVDAEVARDPGTIAVRRIAGRRPAGAASAAAPPTAAGVAAAPPTDASDGGSHPARSPLAAGAATSHHVDPADLAALAHELWGAGPEVIIVSVGGVMFELGDDPSPLVVAAVPRVVDTVAGILAERSRA